MMSSKKHITRRIDIIKKFDYPEYYDRWDKYGVKLTSRIEITKEILDLGIRHNEVCDLIWAINAANQSKMSCAILSNTVMAQIKDKLSPLLFNHKGRFRGFDSAKVVARAKRHFKHDPEMDLKTFVERQTKIINVLEDYINKNSSEKNNTRPVADSLAQGEIPTWDEIQDIYGENEKPGVNIVPDRLKALIEKLFQTQGRKLHPDWWEETKKIIRNESEKQRYPDKTMQDKTILRKKE